MENSYLLNHDLLKKSYSSVGFTDMRLNVGVLEAGSLHKNID